MPLSKERMRKRKRLDRLAVRLNRFDADPSIGIVKPTLHNNNSANQVKPEIDADGQPIPEYY